MKTPCIYLTTSLLLALGIGQVEASTTGTLTFEGQILPGICNLSTGDVNRIITLEPVDAGDFDGETAVGNKLFSISASCDPGISAVTFTFTGEPDVIDSQRFASTGTADGVALWLYDAESGETIRADNIQNTRTVQPDSAGLATLGLGAAYFKIGAIGPGTLKSQVTVKIAYN